MPSNNSKYSEEMRNQTVEYILESGKSATSVAEELGIDTNTVCRWVREYRRQHKMPSYAESRGITKQMPKTEKELVTRNKELERELKRKEKLLDGDVLNNQIGKRDSFMLESVYKSQGYDRSGKNDGIKIGNDKNVIYFTYGS